MEFYNHSFVKKNVSLKKYTWFQVGGPADIFVRPKNINDLKLFLSSYEGNITIIGSGSNVLIGDVGVKGAVIKLSGDFCNIKQVDSCILEVGASVLDRTLVMKCADLGLSGAEFLIGIPGSIGGNVFMNAGACGHEIHDIVIWVEGIDLKTNKVCRIQRCNISPKYRDGGISKDFLITKVGIKLEKKNNEYINSNIKEFLNHRDESQPKSGKTGGSTFKNPENESKKAWEFVDDIGFRGKKIGGASWSEKHCNFILNDGSASSKDIESLVKETINEVNKKHGVELQWEIKRIGNFL